MTLFRYFLIFGFPVLMFTDLGSYIFASDALLNLGRALRLFILVGFIVENIRLLPDVRRFALFPYTAIFVVVQFAYLFTDKDFFEGFWIFSKILFWVLGLNVLYVYFKKGILREKDYLYVLKSCVLIAAVFSLVFLIVPGYTDYNLAAYTVLFMFPTLLLFSNGYKKHVLSLLVASVAILISLKRGALLAFLILNAIYYLYLIKEIPSFRILVAGVLFFFAIAMTGVYMVGARDDLQQDRFSSAQFDIQDDKAGSGRVGLYRRLYESWRDADIEVHLFGFGNQEDSRRTVGRRTHAHSDVFGFLYNHGVIGIGLILLIYLGVLRFYRRYSRYCGAAARVSIQGTFVVLLLVNFYSGLFRSQDAIYLFAIFPLLQGYLERHA